MSTFAKLAKELLQGNTVPYSKFSNKVRKTHQTAFDSGLLQVQRSGAGQVVSVNRQNLFNDYLKIHYPSGIEAAIEGAKCRIDSVALHGDAKRKNTTNREAVLFKAFSERPDLLTLNDTSLSVGQWSKDAGVGAFQLCDIDTLSINGTLGIVENIDMLWFMERLGLEIDIIIYSGGRISSRFLSSLQNTETLYITHLGDYDPVGIDEYLKIKTVCPMTEFYLPQNLEELFSLYGNGELLEKGNTKNLLRRLRKSKDETAQYIIKFMDRYNCGLEQECLLV